MGHVIRADVSVFVSGATTGRANSLVQYGDEHGGDERPEQRRIDHRAGGANQRLRDPAVFCHGRASAAGKRVVQGLHLLADWQRPASANPAYHRAGL